MHARRQCVDEGPGAGEIAAGVDDPFEAQAKEIAVLVEGELAKELGGATMVVAEEGLRARGHPLHRAADLLGGEQQRAIFRIGLAADTKSTTHIMGMNAQLVFGNAGADT